MRSICFYTPYLLALPAFTYASAYFIYSKAFYLLRCRALYTSFRGNLAQTSNTNDTFSQTLLK